MKTKPAKKRGPRIGEVSASYHAAYAHFLKALPELLDSHPGRWAAFGPNGLIGLADDDLSLHLFCKRAGHRLSDCVVGRIVPEEPIIENSSSWFVS